MIVKRNWAVSHFENNQTELRICSHEHDMAKIVVTAIDPEIEPDENPKFEMTIEELETLVAAVKREREFAASAAAMEKNEADKKAASSA